MGKKERYFGWIDHLAPEGTLEPDALERLENAFFLPYTESVRRVGEWVQAHSPTLDSQAIFLVSLVPALFDGRTQEMGTRLDSFWAQREEEFRTHTQKGDDTAQAVVPAELRFLATFTQWRLKMPPHLWTHAPRPQESSLAAARVRSRYSIEHAAALMNRGALVDALVHIEAASREQYLWDGWARTRALTVRFTCNLYLGRHHEAAKLLEALRPKGNKEKRAPSILLAHMRRSIALAQEREELPRARLLLSEALKNKSGTAISRLLIDKERLRTALRAENTLHTRALIEPPESTPESPPLLVPSDFEKIESLLLQAKFEEAFALAQNFNAQAQKGENLLLIAEARTLLAEASLHVQPLDATEALAKQARFFAENNGFIPLALRAKLLDCLCLFLHSPEQAAKAFPVLLQEVAAQRWPLFLSRLCLLRVSLGIAPHPEKDVYDAWLQLLSAGARSVRIDHMVERVRTLRPLQDGHFQLVPFGTQASPSETHNLTTTHSRALERLCESKLTVHFPFLQALLAFDTARGEVLCMKAHSNRLSDALLFSLLNAGQQGRTLAQLHALRSQAPFRADDHAAAVHAALTRVRQRVEHFGLRISPVENKSLGQHLFYRIESDLPFETLTFVHKPSANVASSHTKKNHTEARCIEILALVRAQGLATSATLCSAIGITRQSLRPYLDMLESSGALVRRGKGPGTRYFLG